MPNPMATTPIAVAITLSDNKNADIAITAERNRVLCPVVRRYGLTIRALESHQLPRRVRETGVGFLWRRLRVQTSRHNHQGWEVVRVH